MTTYRAAELAGGIKAHGALAMVQLVHAGRYAGPWDAYHEARRLAPSAVPFELTPGRIVTPHEITPEEIAAADRGVRVGRTAVRARRCSTASTCTARRAS